MLTIFTPTYNRADKLPRLYESLRTQTAKDFEWLIVDDGSTDETKMITEQFPARYVYKENGGKHTAYNLGLELARGDWFFCVDSDDYLTPTAVADILEATKKLNGQQGIIAYKQDTKGNRLSDAFPEGLQAAKIHALPLQYGCKGEFSLIFSTELARKYPFPVFGNERFVTESVIYDRIDRERDMHLLPKTITICEYQSDGYSQNANAVMRKNPNGYCLYFLQRIDLQRAFLPRLVHAGKYWCFRWISGNSALKYTGQHKLLVKLAVIPGALFRVYYKLIRKI